MSRRTLRDDAGVNLFPFMAVLICTVGALIMLLVVMVQQARVKANVPLEAIAARKTEIQQLELERQEKLAEHETQKALAIKSHEEFDELQWRADTLRSSYEVTVGQLAQERLKLSHMESNTRELEEKAAAMQAEADLIAQTANEKVDTRSNAAEELENLRNAIDSAKNDLEQTKKDLTNLDPKYVLIPYKGPNGTDRRPIYIECLADRVVLQPENVPLISEDFTEPLTLENPLARALRAKREFLQDNGLIGADSEPYPLLVVRPGAASTYAAARAAMKAWESEFGYELVEAEVDLDYQDPDPRLRELLEDVVIETRGKRRMMRSMQANVAPRRRERLRPSASGGFESVGGGSESFSAGSSTAEFGDEEFDNTSDQYGSAGKGSGDVSFGKGPSRFETAANGNRGNESDGTGNGSELSFAGPNGTGSQFESNGQNGTSAGGQGEFGSEQFVQNGTSGSQAGQGGEQNGSEQANEQGGHESSPTANNRFRSAVGQANPFRNAAASADSIGGFGGNSATATGSGGQGSSGSGGSSSNNAASAGASAQMGATSSLSQNRGSNWAVRGSSQDAVGIQRPIYIVCNQETIALIPERGTTQEFETFRHHRNVHSVVDAFVDSVQSRLESWGIAGQGIYWKPVLQVRVDANSDLIYQQLRQLLNDSGIEVTREP